MGDFGQWRAAFFPNADSTGAPTIVRNDTGIFYNWGSGAPDIGLPADNFSVRWTRTTPFDTGRYRFYAIVDDGFRLYVDDTLVLNAWSDGGRREVRAELRLQAGYHSLRAEYYERTGDAQVSLNWERLDIYPDWRAEYWINPDLRGLPALIRNDPTLNFVWGAGAPAPNILADNFSARWTRRVDFEAAAYRFHLVVDDGARLWVDDQLILDAWNYEGARELTADLDLSAGAHALRLEYYDRSGHAEARLWWEMQ